ncbi:MAG: hypothetical protein Q8784_00290 [Vigna little leaf phytoplasma]|nr:hypothetical protein [Vigna little leaf phytoplasma]
MTNNFNIIKIRKFCFLVILYLIIINMFFILIVYSHSKKLIQYSLANFCGTEYISKQKNLTQTEITSYHESGHALIQLLYPQDFNILYVTIMPKGETLGHVKSRMLRNNWRASVLSSLGGAAAELFIANENQMDHQEVGKGAGSDLKKIRFILNRCSTNPNNDFNLFWHESQNLLKLNKKTLDNIAQQLMLKKTLFPEDLAHIIEKNPLKKP